MHVHSLQMTLVGGLLAAFAGAGVCQALPAAAPVANAAAATTAAGAQQPAPTRQVADWGLPVQQAKLSASRGGTDTVSNAASLGATVSHNTASHMTTGSNIIDGGSFANMNGVSMVIQNTGANVLIQNATVINLQLR